MVGVILLLSGLSVVLTHNIWNAGFLPLVITLIGWVLILRGILSMFVPGDGIARRIRWLKVEEFSWLYAILFTASPAVHPGCGSRKPDRRRRRERGR
jgi:hypothetical protein